MQRAIDFERAVRMIMAGKYTSRRVIGKCLFLRVRHLSGSTRTIDRLAGLAVGILCFKLSRTLLTKWYCRDLQIGTRAYLACYYSTVSSEELERV